MWSSFGLPPEYKVALHEEIFSLCYYSNGGFGHSDVYGLPVYLRKFYLKKLVAAKKEESDQYESAKGGKNNPGKISRPGITR